MASLNCSLILLIQYMIHLSTLGCATWRQNSGLIFQWYMQPARSTQDQMKACMNNQFYDTGSKDLMQSQKGRIKVDSSEK